MSLPLHQLSKKEYKNRLNFRCVHRHNGLPIKGEHPNCYDQATGQVENIGFLDIESSNLTASFGIVYCYALVGMTGKPYSRTVTLKELETEQYDAKLLEDFIEKVKGYTRLIVHYGSDYKFDIPFLRTRAVYWRLPFPEYKFLYANDTYSIAKSKFKFHSNRLETICDFLDIPAKKHKLKPQIWLKMFTGNSYEMQKALDYITVHCKEDVVSLRSVWKRFYKYTMWWNKKSI
jgi:uncharacterized protein YprB with RNaseH-like and TPR domain